MPEKKKTTRSDSGTPTEQPPAPRAADDLTGRVDLSKRKVLVVDDNRDAADSLGMMLGVLGAEVRVVYDGPEALNISATFAPDFVLLDIGMPGMDGFEVARRFRAQRPAGTSGACTLVAVTGWVQDVDRERSAQAGFNHHLTKPVAIDALIELLGSRKPPLAIEAARLTTVAKRGDEP